MGTLEIEVSEVAAMLKEGIDEKRYASLKNLPIKKGKITAGKYIQRLTARDLVQKTEEGIYKLNKTPLHIGVSIMEGVPKHCIDPKKYIRFVKNMRSILRD